MASHGKDSMLEGRINQLFDKLVNSTKAWKNGENRSRHEIISACFSMIQELEAPSETLVRLTWQQPCQLAAIQTAIDLDLFRQLNAQSTPKTTTQLAESVGADPALMARVLKLLSSTGVVRESGADQFTSAPMSIALESPEYISSMNITCNFSIPANAKTSAFLHETKYQNPVDMLDTPMQFLHGGKGEMNCFQLMHKLDYIKDFDAMMKVWTKDLTHWSNDKAGYYPFEERLVQGARKGEDEVFLVDIAGGQGNDLLKLLALHPQHNLPGRLALQELPQVVESIPAGSLPESIQTMAYDYFTPQPIKGARTYFSHSTVHDIPDDRAKSMLRNIADAMEKGYSKLIIWDFALQDKGVSPFVATMDWQMLTWIAGKERTERDWKTLLEDPEVGLKITGIWQYSQFHQAVIEAELA